MRMYGFSITHSIFLSLIHIFLDLLRISSVDLRFGKLVVHMAVSLCAESILYRPYGYRLWQHKNAHGSCLPVYCCHLRDFGLCNARYGQVCWTNYHHHHRHMSTSYGMGIHDTTSIQRLLLPYDGLPYICLLYTSCWSQSLVVCIVNDSWEIVTCRSRDNYLLSTCCEVCRSLLLRCIETCALKYYVNTKLTPRKLSCVWLSVDSDFLTINDDRVFCCLYSVLALTVLASEATDVYKRQCEMRSLT